MNNQDLQILTQTIKDLDAIGHPDSYRIAKEILSFTNYDLQKTKEIISELEKGKPWEQVRGWSEFYGLKIIVSKDTLIPRVETVEIIELVREDADRIDNIYDIGTGTGAIAIALKKKYPSKNVYASDISLEALQIAKKNIESLNADIELIQSDLLENINVAPNSLVVANLPYISTKDYESLHTSVKDFEPKIALDGGIDGLDIIRRLIEQVRKAKSVKILLLEIDPSQIEKLTVLASGNKFKFYQDFRGLTRFFKLYL